MLRSLVFAVMLLACGSAAAGVADPAPDCASNDVLRDSLQDRYWDKLDRVATFRGEGGKRLAEVIGEAAGNDASMATRVEVWLPRGLANAIWLAKNQDGCVLAYTFAPWSAR